MYYLLKGRKKEKGEGGKKEKDKIKEGGRERGRKEGRGFPELPWACLC